MMDFNALDALTEVFGADNVIVWDEPDDALTQDECDAIGADGRDGRGFITDSNVTPDEAVKLAAFRALDDAGQAAFLAAKWEART